MAEYIEREALLDSICHDTCRIAFCGATNCAFMAKVCSAPAADVAPVVHGRWVTHYQSGTPVAEGYVSTCCDMWNNRKSDYCPHCGAKMDGGDSNAAD